MLIWLKTFFIKVGKPKLFKSFLLNTLLGCFDFLLVDFFLGTTFFLTGLATFFLIDETFLLTGLATFFLTDETLFLTGLAIGLTTGFLTDETFFLIGVDFTFLFLTKTVLVLGNERTVGFLDEDEEEEDDIKLEV